MRITRGLIFAGLVLGALAFAPAARADHWQTSSDGYRYYWSDSDASWYYVDGNDWFVEDQGEWVPCGYVNGGDGYCYYNADRDYRGWRRGRDGHWYHHHHVNKGQHGKVAQQGAGRSGTRNGSTTRGTTGSGRAGSGSTGGRSGGGRK